MTNWSRAGLHKRYQVACVEEEHLSATIDRNLLPTSIRADAFQLNKVLHSFQSSLEEVSLVVSPPQQDGKQMQHIQMASYISGSKGESPKAATNAPAPDGAKSAQVADIIMLLLRVHASL
jgi:hypothetical protein